MEEKTIFKASICCTLIGTLLLIFLAENMEAKQLKISDLNLNMLDQETRIVGNITSIRQTKGLIILSIKDSSGSIPVVLFKKGDEHFEKGSEVEVTGKVSEFNNQIQITAKQIKTLPNPPR
mgnify:CR=1 FL=1